MRKQTTAGGETDDGRWGNRRQPVRKQTTAGEETDEMQKQVPRHSRWLTVHRRPESRPAGRRNTNKQTNKHTKKKLYSTSKRQCCEVYSLLFFIKKNNLTSSHEVQPTAADTLVGQGPPKERLLTSL